MARLSKVVSVGGGGYVFALVFSWRLAFYAAVCSLSAPSLSSVLPVTYGGFLRT